MPTDKQILFDEFGDDVDYGVAYALGVLANLVYYPDKDYDDAWKDQFGFDNSLTVVTPGVVLPNYTKVWSNGRWVFAVAGTTHPSQMWDNIVHSAQVADPAFGDGKIHAFFRWVANGLIPFIQADLAGQPNTTQITFTGHSLGGAAAQLLADWFARNSPYEIANCMVFNSPKVGDEDHARQVCPFGFHHLVHPDDPVSSLPPGYALEADPVQHKGIFRVTFWEQRRPMTEVAQAPRVEARAIATAGFDSEGLRRIIDAFRNSPGSPQHEIKTSRDFRRGFNRWTGRLFVAAAVLKIWNWANIDAHRMGPLCEELRRLRLTTGSATDVGELPAIQRLMQANPVETDDPGNYPFLSAPVDPAPFLSDTPPASPAVTPPPTPPGTRIERITPLVSVASSPAPVTSISPTVQAPPPILGINPALFSNAPRKDWAFKGLDRRILETLRDSLELLFGRDQLTQLAAATSRISTREQAVPSGDDDLQQAFSDVYFQVVYLLSLEHA